MKASDVMTTAVVSIGPETPTGEVAKILGDNGISAVPVIDAAGAPIGMVSEGDLIGRDEPARNSRQDWWLTLVAEGEALNPDFLASLRGPKPTAGDVMASPVVTVGANTELSEIAKLLTAHRIKRVPVVRDGHVVGIVSRADLVRALAEQAEAKPVPNRNGGHFAETLAGIDQRFFHLQRDHGEERLPAVSPRADPDDAKPTAAEFHGLIAEHAHKQMQDQQEHRQALTTQRGKRVAELTDRHISDADWRSLLHGARQAAEQGGKEFMLLDFPGTLCGDGGRAVNSDLPEWPATLRGEAAELYLRWEQDLKPHGFHLGARFLDFPGGMPGDIGLFLLWGDGPGP